MDAQVEKISCESCSHARLRGNQTQKKGRTYLKITTKQKDGSVIQKIKNLTLYNIFIFY